MKPRPLPGSASGSDPAPGRRRVGGLGASKAASLLVVVLAAPLLAQSGGSTGRLEGTATLGGKLLARPIRFRPYSELGQSPPPSVRPAPEEEFQNVVIFLDSVPGDWGTAGPQPLLRLAIEQRDETFLPHVTPLLRGSTVEFPNQDPYFHNVFSLSSAASFDLGQYTRGSSRSIRFAKRGIVQISCHIHSDMRAVALVLDNPFFAVPDRNGSFSLDGVPPGEHTIVAWHERMKPQRSRVRVTAGATTVVELNLPALRPATERR